MDREQALGTHLRLARDADALLGTASAPAVHDWVGSAATAAEARLRELDGALRRAAAAAEAHLEATRRAAADG